MRSVHGDGEDDLVETALIQTIRPPASYDAPLPEFVRATLEVTSGATKGVRYELKKVGTTIGRGEKVDIRVRDEGVSRWHATIIYMNNEFRIADASANGTFLNGSAVKEYAVRNGDKILIGETVFVFQKATT
jgi:pSer/pThr/pTyr-binding forkhead associated (FHA) protein